MPKPKRKTIFERIGLESEDWCEGGGYREESLIPLLEELEAARTIIGNLRDCDEAQTQIQLYWDKYADKFAQPYVITHQGPVEEEEIPL